MPDRARTLTLTSGCGCPFVNPFEIGGDCPISDAKELHRLHGAAGWHCPALRLARGANVVMHRATESTNHENPVPPVARPAHDEGARDVDAQSAPLTASALLALQRSAGNAAAAVLFQTRRPPLHSGQQPSVQRWGTPVDPVKAIATALESKKGDDVDEITSFASATPQQRVDLAGILINDYGSVFGPDDRAHMYDIWNGLGSGITDIVNKSPGNLEIWKKCADAQSSLKELPPVIKHREALINAISGEAKLNLQKNLDYVQGEKDKMGGDGKDAKGGSADSEAMAMVELSNEVAKLQDKRRSMLSTNIGFKYVHGIFGNTADVYFKPGTPPPNEYENGVKHTEVQALWDAASQDIADRVGQFPWLYALIKDVGSDESKQRLATLTGSGTPQDARKNIIAELDRQLAKVRKAQTKAAEFDDWLHVDDLREVHRIGARAKGRFQGWAAEDMIGEQKQHDWWLEFGLEVATDTAFVVSAIATGGAASPIVAGLAAATTVAIPAAQAAAAYEQGRDLKTMQDAVVLPGTDIVSEMQIAAASSRAKSKAIEALLNLVLAGQSIAKAGGAVAVELDLLRLSTLSAERQTSTLIAALKQMDAKSVAQRVGKTLPELAAACGPNAEAKAAVDAEIRRITALSPAARTAEELALIKGTEAGDLLAKAARGESKGMLEESVVKNASDHISTLDGKFPPGAIFDNVEKIAEEALQHANGQLAGQGVPPMRKRAGFGGAGEGTRGEFAKGSWTANYDLAELGQIMHESKSTARAVSTFLHEAQHAEQAWTVARSKAADGMTAGEMAKGVADGGLGIDADVAKEAANRPLPKGSAGYERGQALFKAEFNTAHKMSYEAQQKLIDEAGTEMVKARKTYYDLYANSRSGPSPTRYATTQLEEAKAEYTAKVKTYEAEFQKYKDFASEAEAHAVEDAVLRHHEDMVRAHGTK